MLKGAAPCRLSALLLAVSCAAAAAPAVPDTAGTPDSETVRLRIVLMRHGVRSPTQPPKALNRYSDQPWPDWPVAPGELTAHGAQALQALGGWYHQRLEAAGLMASGCASVATVDIIADSDPRNRASAAALVQGLFPGCTQARYRADAPGEVDALFSGVADDDEAARPAEPAAPSKAPSLQMPPMPPTLAELQRVLLGCDDPACLAQARARGKRVLIEDADRAFVVKTMGSLSENLMLEYVEGMPMASVAWHRADAAGIGRLIGLHNLSFQWTKKDDLAAAQGRASNLLAHLVATLQAAAGEHPETAPVSGPAQRVVFLVGHDTNLATLAGLLHLDWHDPRQPDDYPPGGALVFDLEGQAHPGVRIHTAMPTLEALRGATLAGGAAMVVNPVTLPGCGAAATCGLEAFSALARAAVDPRQIQATAGDEPGVSP
jgi:4-phytase/acid phosphatase